MNDKLEVEPTALWQVGAVDLPLAARQFALAGIEVHETSVYEHRAFSRTDNGFAQSWAAWSVLRDLVQGILRETADNVADTGTVLTRLAFEYADTDTSNAEELKLRAYIDDKLANDGTVDQPPGSVPEVPRPGPPSPTNRRVV